MNSDNNNKVLAELALKYMKLYLTASVALFEARQEITRLQEQLLYSNCRKENRHVV